MTNKKRGEIECNIAGRTWLFCLTLGALAEIESHFGVPDLPALGHRLAQGQLGAQDVTALIAALARGGGMSVQTDELKKLPATSLITFLEAILDLFAQTFPAENQTPENPQQPQRA